MSTNNIITRRLSKLNEFASEVNIEIIYVNEDVTRCSYRCKECNSEQHDKKIEDVKRRKTEFQIIEGNTKAGRGLICSPCAKDRYYRKNIFDKYGDVYDIDDSIKIDSKTTKVKVRCKICNYETETTPELMMMSKNGKHPCKSCNGLNGVSVDEVQNLLREYFGDGNDPIFIPETDINIKKNDKVLLRCRRCGNETRAHLHNVLAYKSESGIYCVKCNHRENISLDFVKSQALYCDVIEYTSTRNPILTKCHECGELTERYFSTTLSHKYCKICKPIGSNGEIELREFISTIYDGEIVTNSRRIVNGIELDIYLPELKLAIEYNGLYWHSSYHVNKSYHLNKTNACLDNGIKLLHIFEDEWLNKRSIIESKITHVIKLNNKKVYARNCVVSSVADDRKFLDDNHVQGYVPSLYKYSLVYNGEVVALMTFGKSRKSITKNFSEHEYELVRYATSVNVVGGFSKLLKQFIKEHNPSTINTFADLRWTSIENNVYTKNGFEISHISNPNYWYVRNGSGGRINRITFQKHKLKESFPEHYNENKTEEQIMESVGYYRIYDCGNLVLKMVLNQK